MMSGQGKEPGQGKGPVQTSETAFCSEYLKQNTNSHSLPNIFSAINREQ